jgi:hypothetical protein
MKNEYLKETFSTEKEKYPVLYDITFYLTDEDGMEVLNDDGTTKEYRLKKGIRYKPLEYIAEELDLTMLEER